MRKLVSQRVENVGLFTLFEYRSSRNESNPTELERPKRDKQDIDL